MKTVNRGGTTIFEMSVAGVLLAALVIVSLQALTWTARTGSMRTRAL